jgi:hypothetical protein
VGLRKGATSPLFLFAKITQKYFYKKIKKLQNAFKKD